jgi:hypothetical protein
MFTLQNILLIIGGWFAASIGAAVVWARIATVQARRDDEQRVVHVGHRSTGSVPGGEVETVVAAALEGSAWLTLGPLHDRVAARRGGKNARAGHETEDARAVGS